MAREWSVNESDCSKINLMNNSDDADAIWLENTWHEVSPNHAATMPRGTKMLDNNDKELTLLDGYCTTYFYKGWQTVSSMIDRKIGNIIAAPDTSPHSYSFYITKNVGTQVAFENKHSNAIDKWNLQVVRLRDQLISLPANLGKNLIPDLYTGTLWGKRHDNLNWYNQWHVAPLAPDDGKISTQLTTFPRTFTIDETMLPKYGPYTNTSFCAPELFAPYMYLFCQRYWGGEIYVGGIIVVIGVKQLS